MRWQALMGFSRPDYWSGQPFPSPGDLPNPGIKPRSPALQAASLLAEPQGKPKNSGVGSLSFLQQIFQIRKLNEGILHCRRILYQLSYQRSPNNISVQFSSVQSLSHVWFFWPCGLQHARPPCPSPTPGAYSAHVHQVADAIQPSHPLSSPSPPTFNLSQHQGLFKWVSSLHQVAKILKFQLQHQSFQWIFRTDLGNQLGLLVVQRTLKSLLQHHSSKALILQRSAFFTVQLSHPYMTIGKTIALTRQTFVGKVMSLLFICCLGWS